MPLGKEESLLLLVYLHQRSSKRWLNKLADSRKKLSGKVAEILHAIVRSVVGAIRASLVKLFDMGFNSFCYRAHWSVGYVESKTVSRSFFYNLQGS